MHARKQPPRQIALCQQQPVIPGVLNQTAAGLSPAVAANWSTTTSPLLNPPRQHQPPPQVPEVVSDHTQPKSPLIGPKPVAAQPRHVHRLLAFLDPQLGRSSFVVETHH